MAKAHILGLTFITSVLHPDHDEYARGDSGDLYPNSGYISLIKVIREVTGLGLKETKDAVDNCFGKEVYANFVEKKARKKFEARQMKFGFIEQDREA